MRLQTPSGEYAAHFLQPHPLDRTLLDSARHGLAMQLAEPRAHRSASYVRQLRGDVYMLTLDAQEARRVVVVTLHRGPCVRVDEPCRADSPAVAEVSVLQTRPHKLHARRVELLIENCKRFARGEPLKNVVDKKAWF